MALPAAVQYGQVKWTVVSAVADSNDVDELPDAVPITGSVTFTPSATVLLATTGSPVTVIATAVTYQLDNAGVLRDSQGRDLLTLVATDSTGITPVGWTWTVSYRLNQGAARGSFSFALPAGSVVDLTTAAPVSSSNGVPIIKGDKGDKGDSGTGGGLRAVFDPASYGAVYDGATNDHAAVQAAIDACSAAGGGIVRVSGNVKNNSTLTLKSGVLLDLDNWTLNGTAAPQIGLPTSGGPDRMGIRGGFITSPGDGISLSLTTGAYQLGWPRITVEDVTLIDCGGRGVYVHGAPIEIRLINVVALRSTGYGIFINTTDTMLIGCTAAAGQSAGIFIAGANSKLTNCKSYGNVGEGFFVGGGGRHMLSACEAQDNTTVGFKVSGAWNTLSACLADSNGTLGFDVFGSANVLTAVAAMYGGGGSGQVTPTGFRLAGDLNVVSGTSGCATTVVNDSGSNHRTILSTVGGASVIDGGGATAETFALLTELGDVLTTEAGDVLVFA